MSEFEGVNCRINWSPERGAWADVDPFTIGLSRIDLGALERWVSNELPRKLAQRNTECRLAQFDWAAHGLVPYTDQDAWTFPPDAYAEGHDETSLYWGMPGGLDVGDPFLTVEPVDDQAGVTWRTGRVGFPYQGAEMSGDQDPERIVSFVMAHMEVRAEEWLLVHALESDNNRDMVNAERNAQVWRGYRHVVAQSTKGDKVPYTSVKKAVAGFLTGVPSYRRRRHDTLRVFAYDVPDVDGHPRAVVAAVMLPSAATGTATELWEWMVRTGAAEKLNVVRIRPEQPDAGSRDSRLFLARRAELFTEDAMEWVQSIVPDRYSRRARMRSA